MFAWDIGFWWCCLNSRERDVLRSTVEGLFVSLQLGIPTDVWDAFWLLHIPNGAALRSGFLSVYHLEIVEIEMGEPVELVSVVRAVDVSVTLSWAAFLLTPPAACLSGCEQSTVL